LQVSKCMAKKEALKTPRVRPTLRTSTPSGLGFPVVAIGASAGGLAAFSGLLRALPEVSGMAFVLIQHLEPEHESALAALLAKATQMPVVEVSDKLAVKPDHVYVIPPNRSMTIRKGALRLAPRTAGAALRHPIDDFATALAAEKGAAAIGVILSGTGSDGTYGLKAIKTAGGVTFAQDPKGAQWPAMPMSAITAGAVDFVLPLKGIAAELARIGRHPYLGDGLEVPEGNDLDKICLVLRSTVGVDFRLYKQATVRRRIARRMALKKIASLAKYAQVLRQNPDEARALADDIFIHVTSFFRDPECFQALRKKVLAKLAKKAAGEPIRIWVAGCSTGEEVYSLAMLLLEEMGDKATGTKIQIIGTDIQEKAVEHARLGIYAETAVAPLTAARLKRFFVKVEHGYQIQKPVRDLCIFARHDLATDPPFSRLDLVSCRNVLIYMGAQLQKRLVSMFQYALRAGGFLFLGKSESISEYSDAFHAEDRKHRIFQRKPSSSRFHPVAGAADPLVAPALTAPKPNASSAAVDLRREAEEMLLEDFAPPALVVDANLHIAHFQGDTSPYLSPATGQPSFHLLKMVRPELMVDLRAAIHRAKKERAPVRVEELQFQHQGQTASVRLEVRPLRGHDGKRQDFLVVFHKTHPVVNAPARTTAKGESKREAAQRSKLERDLVSTREHLRALIADHEAAQEEMKAANEEVLSSNEELQSTNEELETAKEELQSSNEELITLNEELQHRNAELTVLSHDLNNLLVGVDVPVLVLDAALRVRRFTPVAGRLLNLIPGDIGRPFSNIASNLNVSDWDQIFAAVTKQGRQVDREVRDKAGHQYSLRARPYETTANKIEGVLVALLDTDLVFRSRDEARVAQGAAHDAQIYTESILNSLTAHIAVIDKKGTILETNHAWDRFAEQNGGHHVGQGANYLDACRSASGDGRYDAETAIAGIRSVLEGRSKQFLLEYPCHAPHEQRWFLQTVSPLSGPKGGAVVSHLDITARKLSEISVQTSEAMTRALLEATSQSVIAVSEDETIVAANGNTEKMFGYRREELMGQKLEILIPEEARAIHANHHKGFFQNMRSRPMGIGLDLEARRKDGSFFPVEISLGAADVGSSKLAVAFVNDITERKRAETAFRRNEERLRLAVESTGMGTFDLDPRTGSRVLSEQTLHHFGLPSKVEITEEMVRQRVHPDDWEQRSRVIAEAMRPGGSGQFTAEFRLATPQGAPQQWISIWGRVLFDKQGQPERVIGVIFDASGRKRLSEAVEASRNEIRALAARLLTAEEDERTRVSRELHDSICQQLASLAIDMGGLALDILPEDIRRSLKALQTRIVKASEETRLIAYELHPSILDDLGVGAALQSLCTDFSNRMKVPVSLTNELQRGDLPRAVESCIYRVAQESLHNVAKHSHAKKVSLSLKLKDGHVLLETVDDGSGFALEMIRGKRTLGLIGMEERAQLVGGKLSIDTMPGRGTRIALEIPLGPESSYEKKPDSDRG
jgi:PAS domain S-box-containing protein